MLLCWEVSVSIGDIDVTFIATKEQVAEFFLRGAGANHHIRLDPLIDDEADPKASANEDLVDSFQDALRMFRALSDEAPRGTKR